MKTEVGRILVRWESEEEAKRVRAWIDAQYLKPSAAIRKLVLQELDKQEGNMN